MFAGIRPEIRIVEIDEQPLAGGCGALTNLYGSFEIIVATAETVPLVIVGVDPNADADPADAVLLQQFKEIALRACAVPIADARVLQRDHAGHVHAENEFFRQSVDSFDIQCVFVRVSASGAQAEDEAQNQNDYLTHWSLRVGINAE